MHWARCVWSGAISSWAPGCCGQAEQHVKLQGSDDDEGARDGKEGLGVIFPVESQHSSEGLAPLPRCGSSLAPASHPTGFLQPLSSLSALHPCSIPAPGWGCRTPKNLTVLSALAHFSISRAL